MFKKLPISVLFVMSTLTVAQSTYDSKTLVDGTNSNSTSTSTIDSNNDSTYLSASTSTSTDGQKLKPDEAWVCTAWRGSADPSQNSPPVCIKWTKKDCSQRLHKEICKRGN